MNIEPKVTHLLVDGRLIRLGGHSIHRGFHVDLISRRASTPDGRLNSVKVTEAGRALAKLHSRATVCRGDRTLCIFGGRSR